MGQTAYLGRPHCYPCGRPKLRCVCAAVPRVDNRVPLWVLQHPKERRHPFATVPLLRLALAKLRVDVCWQVAASAEVTAELEALADAAVGAGVPMDGPTDASASAGASADASRRAAAAPPTDAGPTGAQALSSGQTSRIQAPPLAVLFPSAEAQDLATLAPEARPGALLLLDGTWSTARSLLRENPVLQRLPHVRFTPSAPSRYRIRREPQADYTSTLEAAISALALLAPEQAPALRGLIDAFDAMVDGQLALRAGRHDVRRRRRGRRADA